MLVKNLAVSVKRGESVETESEGSGLFRHIRIDWSSVVNDYKRLGSTIKVAKEYGCDEATVYYHLKKVGYTLPPRKGRPMSEELRQRLTKINRDPAKRDASRRGGIKALKKTQQSNTWRPTPIEAKLSDSLLSHGIPHRTQWVIEKYVVDVLLDGMPVIIEADGLHHRLPSGIIRDRERDKYLTELGYTVFHLTGDQINANIDWCVERIIEKIKISCTPGSVRIRRGDRSGEHHPMYGKKHTEEAKQAMREKKIGRKQSEEHRQKLSEHLRERWSDPEYRRKMRRVMSEVGKRPEYREKLSERLRERWSDSGYKEKMTGILTEVNRRPEKRVASAKASQTKANQIVLQSDLHGNMQS